MKTLTILTLSILLAACGGSSDSGTGTSQQPPAKQKATYDLALLECGDNLATSFDTLEVSDGGRNVKASPNSQAATVAVSGRGNDLCIGGDIDTITISGDGNDVYINGSVQTVKIDSRGNDVMIFGSVAAIVFNADGNDVWVKSVATYTDNSDANDIMSIDQAEL